MLDLTRSVSSITQATMPTELTKFVHLNHGWNAEPNAPEPWVEADGDDLVLGFALNSFVYDTFDADDVGYIRFASCARFRFSDVNDEGWYRGQCRFSAAAPAWGEFYEVIGDFKDQAPNIVWTPHAPATGTQRNFLFYFRDSAFEGSAQDWSIDLRARNALKRIPNG